MHAHPSIPAEDSIMITFRKEGVTIEFFAHRNPRVTVNKVSHDVWRVRVKAEEPAPAPDNRRLYYRINFQDHLALQAAINAADVYIGFIMPTELVLKFAEHLVTFMGVELVFELSFQYMSDIDDPTPLYTPILVMD